MRLQEYRYLLGLLLLLLVIPSSGANAWSEGGHAIITIMAYQQLSPEKRKAFDELLKSHPNFEKDFAPPPEITGPVERYKWTIGRVGYWPDVARAYDQYNRPTWHFQLGASMTMGNIDGIPIPTEPGPLPQEATMDTQELYVLQALELNRNVLKDHNAVPQQRALALCWIAHLVADIHLPCHSGSLYAESVFTEADGDRGANRITVGEKQRLHGLWDQLLGNEYERGDVNRRVYTLSHDKDLAKQSQTATEQMDFKAWALESRDIAVQYVYVAEVQQAIRAAIEARQTFLPSIVITAEYGKQAGRIAAVRAVQASARLAKLLEESL